MALQEGRNLLKNEDPTTELFIEVYEPIFKFTIKGSRNEWDRAKPLLRTAAGNRDKLLIQHQSPDITNPTLLPSAITAMMESDLKVMMSLSYLKNTLQKNQLWTPREEHNFTRVSPGWLNTEINYDGESISFFDFLLGVSAEMKDEDIASKDYTAICTIYKEFLSNPMVRNFVSFLPTGVVFRLLAERNTPIPNLSIGNIYKFLQTFHYYTLTAFVDAEHESHDDAWEHVHMYGEAAVPYVMNLFSSAAMPERLYGGGDTAGILQDLKELVEEDNERDYSQFLEQLQEIYDKLFVDRFKDSEDILRAIQHVPSDPVSSLDLIALLRNIKKVEGGIMISLEEVQAKDQRIELEEFENAFFSLYVVDANMVVFQMFFVRDLQMFIDNIPSINKDPAELATYIQTLQAVVDVGEEGETIESDIFQYGSNEELRKKLLFLFQVVLKTQEKISEVKPVQKPKQQPLNVADIFISKTKGPSIMRPSEKKRGKKKNGEENTLSLSETRLIKEASLKRLVPLFSYDEQFKNHLENKFPLHIVSDIQQKIDMYNQKGIGRLKMMKFTGLNGGAVYTLRSGNYRILAEEVNNHVSIYDVIHRRDLPKQ